MTKPIFFSSASEFGQWLAEHSATECELIVGFHKVGSGRPCMTWSESVDEALCFGWIDGVRTGIDEHTYKIRFTPRKKSSIWSAINIEKMRALQASGRMQPAGLAAFEHRREEKSKTYSYEQAKRADLDAADEALFKKNKKAWKFFEAQPPGYRHQMIWRILSAKRAETRSARLAKLIAASESGVRLL